MVVSFVATSVQKGNQKYKRTVEELKIPDVVLINQDGKKVSLVEVLNSDQPVVVDFIYGNCITICPVLSTGFVYLQNKLTATNRNTRFISISIDPENDTPEVMKEYLKQFGAKPGWDFLTGSRADIDAVMRGFNAYVPDKSLHYPLNMIRKPKDGNWVRLFGLMSSQELLAEFQSVAGK